MTDQTSGYVDNWQSGKSLAQCNQHMLTSENSCDVAFLVGQNEARVPAHRYVLISRSCVFHAMLCGPLAEKDDIKVPDISDVVFKEFLKFLYTDNTELAPGNVTGLLYLAKKYAVGVLERLCLSYLETSLTAVNACVILEQAHGFDEKVLFDKALYVATQNGDISLKSTGFTDLCPGCMNKVIKSEDLAVRAVDLFSAALLWAEAECKRQRKDTTPDMERLVLGDSIFEISFPTMDMKEFVQVVVPSQILTHEEHTKIFSRFACPELDVSPFKVKQVQCQNVILFYADHKEALPNSSAKEAVFVSCDHDVTVKGLLLYGSKTRREGTCNIWFWSGAGGGYIINGAVSTVTAHSAQLGTRVVDLPNPVALTKNTEYAFEVHMGSTSPPQTLGNSRNTSLRTGKLTFNFRNFRHSSGLIAGLVILPNQ